MASCPVWQGRRKSTLSLLPQGWGSSPAGRGTGGCWNPLCSKKLPPREMGTPGLGFWGSREPELPSLGVCFPTSRAAPRQPGSGAVCGFRISCRCHPERPADRQGSRPLSKTPFHLPGLITPAERRRGHWSQPPPSSPLYQLPSPLPQEPFLSLPSACSKVPGDSLSTCQLWLL